MRCRRCNYPLWNLRERVCPECGTGFKPSEFDLVPSSVQFCCKACMQPYYGLTWRGHLHPPEFACVQCGGHVVMDECILMPTEGVDEAQTQRFGNVLLDRRKNVLARFFTGMGHAMVKPGEMAAGTPLESSIAVPFFFALAVNSVMYGLCWSLVLLMSLAGGMAGVLNALGFIAYWVGAATLGALVWTVVAHAILRVTGKMAGTLRNTFMAIHYAAGANTLTGIVCTGFMFGWIWWVVSACLMLKEIHRIGPLRATAAGLIPPLVLAPAAMIGYGFVSTLVRTAAPAPLFATTSTFNATPPVAPTTVAAGASAEQVAVGLRDAAIARARLTDRFPTHPAQLIADRLADPGQFITRGSMTTDETMIVGGSTIRDLDLAEPGRRLEGFQAAVARDLSDEGNPAWRRVGDALLPDLEGVSVQDAFESELWVVALCVDREVIGSVRIGDGPGELVVIGAQGEAERLDADEVERALAQQNAIRTGRGLRELPDPRLVPHAPEP